MKLQNLDTELVDRFWRFIRGDTTEAEFASWLYASPHPECVFGQDGYLEAISLDFQDRRAVAGLKSELAYALPPVAACECHKTPSRSSLGMTDWEPETYDVLERGIGGLFWMFRIRCRTCGTAWLIAADHLVYDEWLIAREATEPWPEVRTYTGLFKSIRDAGVTVTYVAPMESSIEFPIVIERFAEENPGISLSELTELLPISRNAVRKHAEDTVRKTGVKIDFEK